MVLARGDRGHGARLLDALEPGHGPLARAGMGDLVRRLEALHRLELRPPLGRARSGPRRRRRARRGRRALGVHLRRAFLARSPASRRGSSRSASSPATASRSTCPCAPRSPSPRTPARMSEPCRYPIFSGFAGPAVRERLQDSEAKVVITADWSLRRGKRLDMRATVDEAAREAPSVEHVVTWNREDRSWGGVELGPGELAPLEVDSEHPYLLTYTSGTTGKPKGVAARPGRLPRLHRPRARLPGRRTPRRRHPLRHGHGLDHGPVDRRRRRRDGSEARLRRRRSRLPGRPALAHDRGRGA